MFFTTLLNVGPASLPLYPLQSLDQNSPSRSNPHDWEGNDGIAVYRDPKFISFSSFRSLPTERTSVKSTINSAQILLPYQTVPEHEVHSVVEEMVLLQPDPFLNELTNMYERTKEKGSVWVTFKRSSMKPKAKRKRLESAGEVIEYRCLVRATDAKKTISTSLAAKDYLRFQASYATVLKAHMDALKKRERKDKKKSAEGEKKTAADQNKPSSKPNP